ncbi:MAG: sulfatase-like hydrolase/transferase, partial [Akkermansiaceae bacterium]|nr:sulfatase-like hydrolase/transferase [Akkermansiaceae bacterium]
TTAGLVNGGKYDLNDAGTHVPLLAWGPESIPKGKVNHDLIDVVDLFPTFCEITGATIPEQLSIDGRSIAPQIHGQPGVLREWVHHAIRANKTRVGGNNLFDGSFRLYEDGTLLDARHLPTESPANETDPAALQAREKLSALFNTIQTTQDPAEAQDQVPVGTSGPDRRPPTASKTAESPITPNRRKK